MKANDMIEVTEHNVNIGTAWDYEPVDWCNWSPLQFYFVKE
jgi:hypothetical protein